MLPQENRENADIASYGFTNNKKKPVESMTKCVNKIAAQKTDKKTRVFS